MDSFKSISRVVREDINLMIFSVFLLICVFGNIF